MSAVCQKKETSAKAETWCNVFSGLGTDAKSTLFMKQLTTTCISTILYLRKIFPDSYFESKSLEGMTLKLLKSGENNKCIKKIESWLEGAFEAIDKKYLKHLMLHIKDADAEMTLEIYTMTFNYQKGKENLNITLSNNDKKENIREVSVATTKMKTLRLLQMCHAVTQCYSDLPSQITLDIRLCYYENTPENYQPVGYIPWLPENPVFPDSARSIEIGVTGTKHHFFRLVNKSCLNENFFKGMNNQIKKENAALESQDSDVNDLDSAEKPKARRELFSDISNKNSNTSTTIIGSDSGVPQSKPKNSDEPLTNHSTEVSRKPNTVTDILEKNLDQKWSQELLYSSSNEQCSTNLERDINFDSVRCPCSSEQKSDVMFSCSACLFSVHAECFGILQFDFIKKIRFVCQLCHRPEGKFKCHDKVMIGLTSSSDQQKLALLRKILKFCRQPHVTKITLKNMEKIAEVRRNTSLLGCSTKIMEIILNKMVEIGVAIPQRKRKNFLIDKEQLTNILPHYFYQLQDQKKKI